MNDTEKFFLKWVFIVFTSVIGSALLVYYNAQARLKECPPCPPGYDAIYTPQTLCACRIKEAPP